MNELDSTLFIFLLGCAAFLFAIFGVGLWALKKFLRMVGRAFRS